MTWQERTNAEIRRQQVETQRLQQEIKERARLARGQEMQIVARMFALFDRLNVRERLMEINRNLWGGDGRIEEFDEQFYLGAKILEKTLKNKYSSDFQRRTKGASLAYDFQMPIWDTKFIFKRKFGSYEIDESVGSGFDRSHVTLHRFGFHQEVVGSERIITGWENCSIKLSVGMTYQPAQPGYPAEREFLLWSEGTHAEDVDSRTHSNIYKDVITSDASQFLDPNSSTEAQLKKLIDDFLLRDCVQRTRLEQFPSKIKTRYSRLR